MTNNESPIPNKVTKRNRRNPKDFARSKEQNEVIFDDKNISDGIYYKIFQGKVYFG